jgi:hypothetical protein
MRVLIEKGIIVQTKRSLKRRKRSLFVGSINAIVIIICPTQFMPPVACGVQIIIYICFEQTHGVGEVKSPSLWTCAVRPNQSGNVAGNEGLRHKALHTALDGFVESGVGDICADG